MTVLITLTLAGSDTGPFDLYSDVDSFTNPFQTGVAKSTLESGLSSSAVPDGSSTILVKSTGTCDRDLYLNIAGNTTSTTTSSTTSSSTTLTPIYQLAEVGYNAKVDGCPSGSVLRIFLDSSDYALFVANGYSFAGLGGGAPTTCTAIARNVVGTPITALLFDQENISWRLTSGNFNYYEFQC
jgi:hypothetical protein